MSDIGVCRTVPATLGMLTTRRGRGVVCANDRSVKVRNIENFKDIYTFLSGKKIYKHIHNV